MFSLIAFTWLASPVAPVPIGADDPTISNENGVIAADFGDESRLVFRESPFVITKVEIDGVVIELNPKGGVDYALNNGTCRAEGSDLRLDKDEFVVDLSLTSRGGERRATERWTLLEIHGARGYQRRLDATEPKDRQNPDPKEIATLTYAPPAVAGVRHWATRFNHYGHSTVSKPGITYTLHSANHIDGQRVWVFRSGLHFMNQAVNMDGRNPALTEVVVVERTGSAPLTPGDFISAYVEHPIDRRTLLEEFDPTRAAKEAAEAKNTDDK